LSQPEGKIKGYCCTWSIALINQDKEILVDSMDKFYLLDASTLQTIQEFKLGHATVEALDTIEQGNKALWAANQGALYTFDCKSRELTLIKENSINLSRGVAGQHIRKIRVI